MLLAVFTILICWNGRAATTVSNYTTLSDALSTSAEITNFVNNSTISLTTAAQTIQITKNTIIDAGTNNIIIDGGNLTRLFYVHTNFQLVLANVQVINGWNITNGGAIFNDGVLVISNCIFAGNSVSNNSLALTGVNGNTNTPNGTAGGDGASVSGGAIYSHGPIFAYNSVFEANLAIAGAGGTGGAGSSFTNPASFAGFGGAGGAGGFAYGAAIYSTGSNNVFFATEFLSNTCAAGPGGLGGPPGVNPVDPLLDGGSDAGGAGGAAAGGALFLSGPLSISNCLFTLNTVLGGPSAPAEALFNGTGADLGFNGIAGGTAIGGGLFVASTAATAYLENTIFYQNVCAGGAGGAASATSSTGGDGGAVAGGGLEIGAVSALVRNCTFATNILLGGPAGLDVGTNGTVGLVGTTAGWDIFRSAGVVRVANSILSGTSDNANGVTDAGYNICSDASLTKSANSTTRTQTNPMLDSGLSAQSPMLLGPVGIDRPPLLTLAILLSSPATNAIPGVPGLTFPATDERLLPRGTPASIGAFEVNTITVVTTAGPASITVQPVDQTNVALGETTSFHVAATPNPDDTNALGYQWQLNGTNLPEVGNFSGVNSPNLTINDVTAADLGAYQVIVSPTLLDSVTNSALAYLLADVPTTIKTQPAGRLNVPQGSVEVLKVSVGGAPPFFYQWYSNKVALTDGNEFSGSATTNLTINPVTLSDAASYQVVITNFYHSVTSAVARLTVVLDATRPSVTLTNIAANARPTNNVIAGTASDNAQVTNVFCSITNIFEGISTVVETNAVLSAGSTVKTWSLTNALLPGTNIVVVQSVDYSGNLSAKVTRKFFYTVPSEFYLNISGTGIISGAASVAGTAPPTNTAMLNIGEGYTLTARPGVDCLLTNWTSESFISYTNPLRFTMTSNLTIQANFVTSPFLAVKGTYNGLFFETNTNNAVTAETAGMLNDLVIGPLGAYSGKLLLAGTAYPISGTFNIFGYATNYLARAASRGGPVGFEMSLVWTNGEITGAVSGTKTNWVSSLNAEENATTTESAESTMLLSASTNGTGETPPGFGYVLMTNHLGHLTLTGALPDGTVFSQSVPLGTLGDVPLYESLYGNAGLVLGWVTLTNATPEATNGLIWIKPSNKSVFYQDGFTNSLAVQGSPWTNGADFSTEGTLTFSNTVLGLAYPVSIAHNAITDTSAPTSVKGTVNPNTGLVTITFETGDGKATLPGHGAILRNTTNLGGYFLTKTNAGIISLQQ